MKRTCSAAGGLVFLGMLLSAVGLMAVPASAKCGKDCKHSLTSVFKACKAACEKGKAGKSCRMACSTERRAAKAACKAASNPTPPDCGAATSSTSTTIPGSCSPTGMVVKGSLTATPGRFNYNAALGLPGANAACNTHFAGSHACTLAELQGALASDLACLKDTAAMTVTSFWAIDPNAAGLSQCIDDVVTNQNWEYGTAHTASRGQRVTLNNATGALGSLETGLQCNISGNNWVACCQ